MHDADALLIGTKAVTGFAAGAPMKTLDQKAASTVELTFDACFVPVSAVLDEVGAGYQILLDSVLTSRISGAAQGVAVERRLRDPKITQVDDGTNQVPAMLTGRAVRKPGEVGA